MFRFPTESFTLSQRVDQSFLNRELQSSRDLPSLRCTFETTDLIRTTGKQALEVSVRVSETLSKDGITIKGPHLYTDYTVAETLGWTSTLEGRKSCKSPPDVCGVRFTQGLT